MCSTAERRIAEIGQAIDDLAMAGHRVNAGDRDEVVGKLAELWALLAELDPDIARRMPTYQRD